MTSIINFRLIEGYGRDEQFGYTPVKGTIDARPPFRPSLAPRSS
jgi:hypothetical protein